jgi:hypothetical protein
MEMESVHPKNPVLLVIKGLRRSWQVGLNRVSQEYADKPLEKLTLPPKNEPLDKGPRTFTMRGTRFRQKQIVVILRD